MVKFGPFELDRMLGRGGTGEAFLAHKRDDPMRTPVVLKRLRPEVARSPEYEKRLMFEAQVAARIHHPNLVRLLEFGRIGECNYLTMEHVRGYSLKRLLEQTALRDQPSDPKVAVTIICGILEGLGAMHRQREESGELRPILHRDVTPGNVIITHQGLPILIDFGIAKDVLGPAITMIGKVVGTARYMSPEQRLGDYADARADLFSAGVIFFEMLTARQPWPSLDPKKEVLRVVFDAPELLPEVRARIPDEILPIVLHAIECNPEHRYPDTDSMLAALRATNTYRSLDPKDHGAPVRVWLNDVAIRPDEQLETMIVDTLPMEAGGPEDLAWSPTGELAPADPIKPFETVRTEDLPAAKLVTIPPLPPRRESNLELEPTAIDPPPPVQPTPARWIRFGVLLLIVIVLGVGLGVAIHGGGF